MTSYSNKQTAAYFIIDAFNASRAEGFHYVQKRVEINRSVSDSIKGYQFGVAKMYENYLAACNAALVIEQSERLKNLSVKLATDI